jgi:class 3 adenylate cyclase/tetratricopeptide (TPR) repeat protein
VREACERGARQGVQVLYGRCSEDLPLPYLPFVEALEPILRDASGPEAETLGRLLRRGGDVEPGDDALTAVGAEQLRLFRAVASACVALAQRRPTMLVLDDLHWADRSTLDLLQHVVFAVADAAMRERVSLLVVATYRSGEVDERLARAIARLQREHVTLTIDVPGLDEPEIAALLRCLTGTEPTHQLVLAVGAATLGNPLFIHELVQDLARRGALRRRGRYLATAGDVASVRLPMQLTGMIGARTQKLARRCHDVLGFASLLGGRFSMRTLAAVTGVAEDELLDLLEEAMRERLLVSEGAMFEFAHPIVRQVLASQPSGLRVQRMHLQIATALERLHAASPDDHLLEITHHMIAAGPVADPRAVLRCARLAGDRTIAMSAWADAARYSEAALAAADAIGDCSAHDRAVLHHRAAFAYSRDLDAGPCLEQYELAVAAYRATDDVAGLARAVAEQTHAHVMLASAPYGALVDVGPLREVLAALGDGDAPLRAQCLATLALAYWTARRPEEAERAAHEALSAGVADERLLASAHHALALAQLHTMRQAAALESWERSRAHARRAGDRWLEGIALQRIPTALVGLGRLQEAEAVALEACALGRETHNWAGCSVALGNLVLVAVATGSFAAAEEHAHAALTMACRARYGWAGPYFLPALACARVLRGAWVEAEDVLDILVTPGRVFDDPGPAVRLLAWVEEQLVRAHAGTVEEGVGERLRRLATAGAPAEIVNLAGMSALVEAGDLLDDATMAAGPYDALRGAAERGVVLTIGWVFLLERVLAVAATRAGAWDRAEHHFAAAAATAARIGAAPELARTRLDHARMLLARDGPGDRDRAGPLLTEAAAGFDRLGMVAFVGRTACVAERCGALVPHGPAGASDTERLGPADLDLLRRIGEGRSVREIADELTLSPASAERRIRALLEKVRSRGGAADVREGIGSGRAAPPSTYAPTHPLVVMFTDIEGSTAAIDRLGDTKAREMLGVHDAVVRSALLAHGGAEVNHTGDGLMATFRSASAAVACAIAIQRMLAQHAHAHPDLAIRVRIGLNAGEPLADREWIFGAAVNAAARICNRARGGEILVADVVRQLAAGKRVAFVDRRRVALKGFRERFHLFEVPWQDAR